MGPEEQVQTSILQSLDYGEFSSLGSKPLINKGFNPALHVILIIQPAGRGTWR